MATQIGTCGKCQRKDLQIHTDLGTCLDCTATLSDADRAAITGKTQETVKEQPKAPEKIPEKATAEEPRTTTVTRK